MAGRTPSPAERALWRRSMGDVKRLKSERPTSPPEETPRAPVATQGPAPRPKKSSPPPPALPPLTRGGTAGVDRRTADKLRRGRLGIGARLDLHGLTQAEAHRALTRFLGRAQEDGARTVLVITGKGARSGEAGVLREAVPRWLNEPALRRRVLSFTHAQQHDGGTGALYILLKRLR